MQRWLASQSKGKPPMVAIFFGLAMIYGGVSGIANWGHAGQYGGHDVGGVFIALGIYILAIGIAASRERRSSAEERERQREQRSAPGD